MKRQTGFILITGMVFLIVITLIVVYLLRASTLEERMAANSINRQKSLQAAEATLREAETLIQTATTATTANPPFDPFLINQFSANCSQGYCRNLATNAWSGHDWSSDSNTRTSAYALTGVPQRPRYIVELMEPPVWTDAEGCSMATYRIIAKGWGDNGAETFVQSHFQHRPSKCR